MKNRNVLWGVMAALLPGMTVNLYAEKSTDPPTREISTENHLPFGSLPTLENPWGKIEFGPDDVFGLEYGISARWKYEFYSREYFNEPYDPDGFLLQRYLLFAKASITENFFTFVQFQAGLENGRPAGPRPIDQNTIDVHQLYGDLKVPVGNGWEIRARAGRQEMPLGSQRLVSVREGPNLRQSFDAARLYFENEETSIQLIVSKPVETDDGYFTSQWDRNRALWGVYGTTKLPWFKDAGVDVYYLGYNNKNARFNRITGNEVRHSFGTRFFGKQAGFDWNYEFVIQTGTIEDLSIFAWTVATETGFTFDELPWKPRLFLKANYASGDSGKGPLGTFNAMFPKASYFNDASLYGPYNLMDLQPGVEFQVLPSLNLLVSCDFVARANSADGLYGPPGNLLARSNSESDLSIGIAPNLVVRWLPSKNLEFAVNYVPYVPGGFVVSAGGGSEPVQYLSLLARVTF